MKSKRKKKKYGIYSWGIWAGTLGAEVIPVKTGTATLKDAVSEAMREWTSRISDTHYCLGSVMGPHPFPTIVRDFQAVISREQM